MPPKKAQEFRDLEGIYQRNIEKLEPDHELLNNGYFFLKPESYEAIQADHAPVKSARKH
jgi:hypothetical protein